MAHPIRPRRIPTRGQNQGHSKVNNLRRLFEKGSVLCTTCIVLCLIKLILLQLLLHSLLENHNSAAIASLFDKATNSNSSLSVRKASVGTLQRLGEKNNVRTAYAKEEGGDASSKTSSIIAATTGPNVDQKHKPWKCTQLKPNEVKKFRRTGASFIYLLGGQMSGKGPERLVISGEGMATFDVLMEGQEMRGAFDVVKTANGTIMVYNSDDAFTTKKGMGPPLWLVVHKEKNADVAVHLAVDEHSMKASSSSAATLTCPRGLSPTNRQLQDSFQSLTKKLSLPERRPFFKRRNKPSGGTDLVTVCTQLTVDRLSRLESMATNFGGPVSAAVFVGRYRSVESEMEEVADAWEGSDAMRKYVDIHVVIDSKEPWFKVAEGTKGHGDNPYPVNILRQESIIRAETEWILLAEGDMVTAPKGHELIKSTWKLMLGEERRLLQGKNNNCPGVAFVVPLYSAPTDDPRGDKLALAERVPNSKDLLVSALKEKKLERMSDVYDSHKELDYRGWEQLRNSTFLYYRWTADMEPYYIARKTSLPPFDPLFMGMMEDKRSQLRHMGFSGFSFVVHPSLYVVNFGSDGLGEAWISEKVFRYWRGSFVQAMHQKFVTELKKRRRLG